MRNTLQSLLILSTSALLLTACGGGSDGPNPEPPAPSKARINSSNYTEAVGLGGASADSSQNALSALSLPMSLGAMGDQSGTIACPGGGSLTLIVSGSTRTTTAQNCKDDEVEMVSGSISITNDPASATPWVISFQDVKARGTAADATLNTVNGEARLQDFRNGAPTGMTSKLTVANTSRTDTYDMTINSSGQMTLLLSSSKFDGSLKLVLDETARSLKVSSTVDGSNATITWTADGKSFTVEIRETENGPTVTSKTLTLLEFLELLKKWR